MTIQEESPTYSEATEQDEPRQVQLAHLSIEVGHFYMDDLVGGEARIREQFRRVAPWVRAAQETARAEYGATKARISTCFLADDYFNFNAQATPQTVIPMIKRVAEEFGVTIDYVAREAGCCLTDAGVPLAEITAALLVPEPPVGTNGSRPPLQESGWLCNGERSADGDSQQAMQVPKWRSPVQFGKRNHSIFLDVELWKETVERVGGKRVSQRTWSCPFLAAVWHLLRLGMLRYYGEPVAVPERWTDNRWPDYWSELPTVIQLSERAAPFSAYRTVSILPRYYLPIENAVEVILNHLDLDEAVVKQVIERGEAERIDVPAEVTRRISHVFVEDVESAPRGQGT